MRKTIITAAMALPFLLGAAHAQDSIKIGYIDPLSGGGASVGEGGLKTFQYLADEINAKGGILGHKVEIVPMDNKVNPQESLVQAQKAIDAGIHYITQGNGSSVGAALEDFVTKNNTRNPGKELLYFNYAAVDPSLTNEKCSYWHFRWDANSDIKMEALTNYMKGQQSIKKVYLINRTIRLASRFAPRRARCSPRSGPISRSSATNCTRCSRSPTSRPISPRSRPPAPTAS